MTLETFFENFDLFADAPDAVAKMRELVWHLAVTGALVEQDANDEPAMALLDKIAAHKSALAKEGKLRGPTSVAPMSPDEGTRVLPSSWTWVRFGEIMVNRDGERIPVSKEERATKAKTYDYYGASGVIDKINGYLFDKPLLLIGEDGANLINRSTPIAFMARGHYWVNNHAHVLDGISEDFLRYIELHINAINLEPYVTGSAQPKMNQAKMNSIPIGLPPLAEQKRIVAKVDELMALCDRLEAQQQERETRHAALARASLARFADAPTPANLPFLFHPSYAIPPADLRKSILTLAVQGKLVPQVPNDEPAARVLERIDAAPKRAMRTRATDEEEGAEPTELEPLFELPPGWEWVPFRRLPLQASVGIDRGRSMQGPDKAVGYFKMNNIRNSGGVDLSDLTRIDATPEEVEALALADGDFLFNTRNSRELVGKTCVFRAPSDDPILYNNNILRVRFIEGFSPDFLDYWFRSPEGSAALEKLKSNTTNVCAIYQGKLSGFPCVIPPLAEQRRIVAKVEQLMALVDALETQLAAARTTAANLLSALVAELTTV